MKFAPLVGVALLSSGCASTMAARGSPIAMAAMTGGARQAVMVGNVDQALQEYSKLATMPGGDQNAELHYEIALALAMAGLHEAALATIDRADRMDGAPGSRWYAAQVFAMAGQETLASDLAKGTTPPTWIGAQAPFLVQRYRRPPLRTGLGSTMLEYRVAEALAENGAKWRAVEAWRDVVETRPDHPLPRTRYSAALESVGAIGEAIRQTDEATIAASRRGDAKGQELLRQRRAKLDTLAKSGPPPTARMKDGSRNMLYVGGRAFSTKGVSTSGGNFRFGSSPDNKGRAGSADIGWTSTKVEGADGQPDVDSTVFSLGGSFRYRLGPPRKKEEVFWTYGFRMGLDLDAEVFSYTYALGIGSSSWFSKSVSGDVLLEMESTTVTADGTASDPAIALVMSVGLTTYFGGGK